MIRLKKCVSAVTAAAIMFTFVFPAQEARLPVYAAESDAKAQSGKMFIDEEELKKEVIKDFSQKMELKAENVTGSEPWNSDQTNGVANVVDGDYNTFFDGVEEGWVEIDLGSEVKVGVIGYAPRPGMQWRCEGGEFFGSNDGVAWTPIYQIGTVPPNGISYVCFNEFNGELASAPSYRYIRYEQMSKEGKECANIAEIEVFSLKDGFQFPDSLQSWVAYYEGKMEQKKAEGHSYTPESQDGFDRALAEAKALFGSADEAAKSEARNKMIEAFLALKEVFAFIKSELPTIAPAASLQQVLPTAISVQYEEENEPHEEGVAWSGLPGATVLGSVEVTGTLESGRIFTHDISLYDEKMVYFFDCNAGTSPSPYFNQLEDVLQDQLRNTAADQAYSEKTKAGYAGILGTDMEGKAGADMWSRGYQAKEGKDLEYAFHLEPGEYKAVGGYQDWDGVDRQMDMAVSVSWEGQTVELAAKEVTLPKGGRRQEDIAFSLDHEADVTITVGKSGENSPVLSWVAVMQETKYDKMDTDKELLAEAIRKAESLKKEDYTSQSWNSTSARRQRALDAAKEAKRSEILTQAQVDAAAAELVEALQGLVTVKSALEEGIKANTVAGSEQSKYTAASWEAYDAKLQAALALLEKETLTENEANKALKDLVAAKAALAYSDKTQLDAAISQAEQLKQEEYTQETWSVFAQKLTDAKKVQASKEASQAEVDAAKEGLMAARDALVTIKSVQEALKRDLEAVIKANTVADSEKGQYTEASWNAYKSVLEEAKGLLADGSLTAEDVAKMGQSLRDAKSNLEKKRVTKKNQAIRYSKSLQKAYGAKAFRLDAKVTVGDGRLSYRSSDKKVAVVDKNGKVTLKGSGVCTITATAAATALYNKKSVSISLKVTPKKPVLSSAKAVKGKKLAVKWKKVSKADGYLIQYALKKDFKGAKKIEVKKPGITSATMKGLKAGKKYYVRICAYKKVKINKKNTKLCSAWSAKKTSEKVKK
ncbi:MAG: hypothetical protein HFH38_05340 [Lachnospiraceae bacterium]|jgi:hypothetical protein|nr:hypothetical protein [Lachnospiraceae bacterium]